MAIQDFTKYLGSHVKFNHKPSLPHDESVQNVEGVITEVLIKQNLHDSEFVIGDRFYNFKSVNFVI